MRHLTLALMLACSLSACGDEDVDQPVNEAVKPVSKAKPETPAKGEGGALKKELEPLPDAVQVEGSPTVAILGYGARFELNPPFQAADMTPRRDGEIIGEGQLVISWWDVTAKNAGRSGIVGLHNVVVIPKEGTAEGAEPTPGTYEEGRVFRQTLVLGEGGTEVRFPKGASELGGAVTVKSGPTHPVWKVQVGDAEPVEWPGATMLHSGDPAKDGPIFFDGRPRQPWGPWPVYEAGRGPEAMVSSTTSSSKSCPPPSASKLPARTDSAATASAFIATVLPPALGPEITSTWNASPSTMSFGTASLWGMSG